MKKAAVFLIVALFLFLVVNQLVSLYGVQLFEKELSAAMVAIVGGLAFVTWPKKGVHTVLGVMTVPLRFLLLVIGVPWFLVLLIAWVSIRSFPLWIGLLLLDIVLRSFGTFAFSLATIFLVATWMATWTAVCSATKKFASWTFRKGTGALEVIGRPLDLALKDLQRRGDSLGEWLESK